MANQITNGPAISLGITESQYVNSIPVVNGRLLALSDKNGMYYEYNNIRRKVDNGHTIKNASSTSMTDRTNLQFNTPFTITDDSSNDKLIVRLDNASTSEMAEFTAPSQASSGVTTLAALDDTSISSPTTGQVLKYDGDEWVNSTESLNDLSNVSISAPSIGDSLVYNGTNWVNGEPYHSITSTERLVGKWIDDSDIYEKTISFNVLGTADVQTGYTQYSVAHNISNVELVIQCFGMYILNGYSINLPNYDIRIDIDDTNIIFKLPDDALFDYSSLSTGTYYVTLRYLKTTN